jgi:hypothetical protein
MGCTASDRKDDGENPELTRQREIMA